MKNKMTTNVIKAHIPSLLLVAVIFMTVIPNAATAKSLYVIADRGHLSDATQPVNLYDIGFDGSLTFQTRYDVIHRALGAMRMTIDSDNGFLFITYKGSNEIQLLDARTMIDMGMVLVPDDPDLADIVYDHKKKRVYCIGRDENLLHAYDWDPLTVTLTQVPDSPFLLQNASAHGIALDDVDDLLYVANETRNVNVYSTTNWELVSKIKLNHVASCVAVDGAERLLYAGGGNFGDMYLTQYYLATGHIDEIQVEPDAGVIDIDVDLDTGYIYLTTGIDSVPGGDNLQGYDRDLNLIALVSDLGNPTGLVIPLKDINYNPLGLNKTAIRGVSYGGAIGSMPTVSVGDTLTYGIDLNNQTNETVTNVSIVDTLPEELVFVSADDDGISGSYDPKTHSFEWSYSSLPPDIPLTLELTAQVKSEVKDGTVISNIVSINSDQTPPATKRCDVQAGHNALNLTKRILDASKGQYTSVIADTAITYIIEFDNDNNFTVTDIFVLDVLPKEVTFISAQSGKVAGKYNAVTHTCSWELASLEPGEAVRLELNGYIKEDLAKGTIFSNLVTLENKETPAATATADAIIGETPSTAPELKILPEIVRRDNVPYDIQASIIFQEGFGKQDVADVLPTLYDLNNPNAAAIKAKQLFIYGTTNTAKVIALFDKNELLNMVTSDGEATLKMVGTLTSGRTYSAEGTVYINRYSGN